MSAPKPRITYLPYGVRYGRPTPLIQVTLFRNEARVSERALIDSGADASLFSAAVATQLGIDIERGRRLDTIGWNGARMTIYLHRVGLTIADFHVSATVGFSADLQIGFNLLGRYSIFDQLQFCFNDRLRAVLVSSI